LLSMNSFPPAVSTPILFALSATKSGVHAHYRASEKKLSPPHKKIQFLGFKESQLRPHRPDEMRFVIWPKRAVIQPVAFSYFLQHQVLPNKHLGIDFVRKKLLRLTRRIVGLLIEPWSPMWQGWWKLREEDSARLWEV
jgi:hypothetical protein